MLPTALAGAEFTATSTYSSTQYSLVLYSFVVAAFALFATGVYGAKTTAEIGKAYRPAAIASTLICWVATLAYVALILEWVLGFNASADGSTFTPAPGTVVTELRYTDWSVTVPLLTVELLAVAALTRSQAFRLRTIAVPAAFLMIATGYLGVVQGEDSHQGTTAALWVWGAVSTAFFIVLYVIAWRAYRATKDRVSAETRISYRNALVLLLSVFGAYPLAYLVPAWAGASNAGWATTEQLVFSFADIAAKAGFGLLIHKVAKLRTAEDALAAGGGTETHRAVTVPDTLPSEVWVSGTLLSVPPVAASAVALDGTTAASGPAAAHRS
ncbi:bacteriorhodopsin [Kineococcus rhizosphaerae]|uniref:Bacteriorhodopsin n=1 Tax=Kineococcus rhizosphaerae TaxID=559628 RepID=A0A2T0QZF7_9ACTN|nr:bacteriorhodopsin [Kineococcus rhizosphaerae]PRY12051.1 bacteriorhodopsin [Kineococcus rhizosphaerae]